MIEMKNGNFVWVNEFTTEIEGEIERGGEGKLQYFFIS